MTSNAVPPLGASAASAAAAAPNPPWFPPATCKAMQDVLATFENGDFRGAKQKHASYKAKGVYMPKMDFTENTDHPGGFMTTEVDGVKLLLHVADDGEILPVLEDTQVYGVVRRFQKYKLEQGVDLNLEELKIEVRKLFYFDQECLNLLEDGTFVVVFCL